jgi:Fe-S-cluster containining protein
MRRLIEFLAITTHNHWIYEILKIFEPVLTFLGLDEGFFVLKQNEFLEIVNSEKQFLVHPFHIWFHNLLKKVIILNSQAVYDSIRDMFLNHFAIRSPNCLQCPEEHGCCHGNYSIELIDYRRIISMELIDPSIISRFHSKYKIKLIKDENGNRFCGAFDRSSKKCLIHQFKPQTCCKYPLVCDVHNWSYELLAWTGTCAHSDIQWATRVHPAIMNSTRDLWVHSNLLWETEQEISNHLKKPLEDEIKQIILRILAIKQYALPYKAGIIKKILLEDFSEAAIQKAFQIV